MNHYIDIRLQPDPEFSAGTLMNALCSKLHRVLVEKKETGIGISFPAHALKPKRTLGDQLRLHGNKEALGNLMQTSWLNGMRDHIHVSATSPAPPDVGHRIVRRRQFKTNAERLRRRRAKRHGETMDQARERIPDNVERKVQLPSLTLHSRSTGQPFHLFVEHGPLQKHAASGAFNSYGLSQDGTVPWF